MRLETFSKGDDQFETTGLPTKRTPGGGSFGQGRSQPHSPAWARVPLSSFCPQNSMNFPIFPQTLLIFFHILALRVGESPTREGPGYATAF